MSFYKSGNVYLIRAKRGQLQNLLKNKNILFADSYEQPKEELTTATLDLATNQVNRAQSSFPFINGEGLVVSVKENKPDTSDLDYIGRYIHSGLSAGTVSPHATIMATTIAGAGNTSSFGKGVAPKTNLTSSDFASLLPDADAVFRQYGITVQNHSYGTIIQNYYGAEATAYDVSAMNNRELLHVFSSGNAGISKGSGSYNEIEGVANLTGNFKMAKNILTVGAIDSLYNVSAQSSKGPAYDGRVKPELVAFGEDGSSGAAAMVSGAALLVQHAYQLKYGHLPLSATTKAILINSAADVGARGIDFASGYGNLNAYAAVKTVQEGRLLEGLITSNNKKSFQIIVPANAASMKVTLVWADPAAAVNAPKALVNDLDLLVKSPSSQWLPWVLSSKPHRDSILKAPERRTDTLNTIEQVTVDAPVAGTYTIEVVAKAFQTTEQSFSIAYQIDTMEAVNWTFPVASDKLEAGTTSILRWESNKTGSATIEYSTDKNTWLPVATVPNIQVGYYKWAVPNSTTTAWLRLTAGNASIVSDTFVISSIPRMDVGFQCADSFLLLWNKQPVPQYQLFELNEKYMSPVSTIADTFALLKKSQHPAIYYTVAPVVNGKLGLQAPVLNYTAQGVDCYFKNFYLQNQTTTTASLFAALGSIYGTRSLTFQKWDGNRFANIQVIDQLATTQFAFDDPALRQGLNQYRLALQLTNGQTLYSDVVDAYHFNDKNVI
ncbi:MAG TPA: S8 family serine peptidase, partial [Flavisolibacter sp.]|nr:S8 family serine peptidase [Flavisolibacter sp.]